MKLPIAYKSACQDRPWLIRREGGHYSQHVYMRTKKDAEKVRALIDRGKYPYCRDFKVAMQRLLTEEEFRGSKKRQRYFNPQKGTNLGSITPKGSFMGPKSSRMTLFKMA